jgi:phosphoribosylformylglycinamidine cyclo-ligase
MNDGLSYSKAGVDIDAMDAAKKQMASSIDSDDPRVLNRMGAFASLLDGRFEGLRHPILVFKTEEPGSKQKLAIELGRLPGIAYDLVNHLINDVIVMGAAPVYMQDCIICAAIDSDIVTTLVKNMAAACREQDCVLVGGETSVQPGVVPDGMYVLSASAIGVVDKDCIVDGSRIKKGDAVLAVASNGLHTNGYTLVRKLLDQNPTLKDRKVEGTAFIEAIMRPHMCYYQAVRGLFRHPGLKGMAHITGGGVQDNLRRILPATLDAVIDLDAIRVPPLFRMIRDEGKVPDDDMLRTFNMGVGLTVVCSPDALPEFESHLKEKGCTAYRIGEIMDGGGKVGFSGELRW